MADATIKQVSDFMKLPGETLKSFRDQWMELTDQDKDDLRKGIGDGTLTY